MRAGKWKALTVSTYIPTAWVSQVGHRLYLLHPATPDLSTKYSRTLGRRVTSRTTPTHACRQDPKLTCKCLNMGSRRAPAGVDTDSTPLGTPETPKWLNPITLVSAVQHWS
ncbi:hypothetical protein IAQ61_011185 [Plenodomus lingam]|uniref:uncharacterized protein n=1 Tax=Leptosphaeria maculans TaxID=5022 RepID=UPI0033235D51|nr:hypothetical protein IAQ61_011185 [Plenodomus lingam]